MNRLMTVVATAILVGCGNAVNGPTDNESAATYTVMRYGESIQLKVGQRVRLGSTGPVVSFTAVRDDHRCPQAVTCVWQGDAVVELAVHSSTGANVVELHTGVEPDRATIGDQVLVLEELSPVPVMGKVTAQREYTASLRLESR